MLGHDVKSWGLVFRYAVDEAALSEELLERFVPMTLDTEGEAFVVHALEKEYSRWKRRLHWLMTRFASDFDVNGRLGVHPVFLLSTPQALELLPDTQRQTLVDVGAGSGDVTTRLGPLFHEVRCSEVSRPMARRLRRRGFACFEGRVLQGAAGDPLEQPFDVVALCNVLDRCAQPRELLRTIASKLTASNRLLLSCPLPYEPHYYQGGRSPKPDEPLRISAQSFETALEELRIHELEPLGLEVTRWTRVPYLSAGNDLVPLLQLDAAVVVCGALSSTERQSPPTNPSMKQWVGADPAS